MDQVPERQEAEPEVVSCYFDTGFEPALAAMKLHWPDESEQLWRLPGQVMLLCAPPRQFGLRLQRIAPASYSACLVWDQVCLRWNELSAQELRQSDLGRVLLALKSDLNYLLDQPIDATPCRYSAVG
ncbi:MAG: hypothetical protein AB7K24_03160 [Gemmataceae bacterium]